MTGVAGWPLLDHVTLVAGPDDDVGARLRRDHGLGSWPGGYLDHLGARSHFVPLLAPAYLEWLTVEDEAVAAGSDTGRMVLAARAAGGAVAAWTLLVDDIEAVSRRVGVPVYEGTTRIEATGVIRRWSTVTGPPHLPIFIAYDGLAARLDRLRKSYADAAHTCAPGGYARIEVGGSPDELAEWLGPHDLPVTFVDGPPGIRAACIATAHGPVVLS